MRDRTVTPPCRHTARHPSDGGILVRRRQVPSPQPSLDNKTNKANKEEQPCQHNDHLWAGTHGIHSAPDINETLIKEIADKMVSTDLKDAGYEYVVISDSAGLSAKETHRVSWKLPPKNSLGNENSRRVHPLKGPEIRYVLLRGDANLRRLSRQLRSRIRRRENARRLRRRFPEI